MKNHLLTTAAIIALTMAPMTPYAESAVLRMRGIGAVPPSVLCPMGEANMDFDRCDLAEATAEFKDPNLITTFALSSTGNPQTLYHLPPYNVAGQHFGVGQTTTTGKEDPRDLSVVGTGSIIGNNVIFSTITNGGTPKVGMWIWDRPAGGTQYYAAGQAPKISGPCTGTYPALTCPLDRAVTNRSGHTIYASLAYGCVTLIQGGGTNGTSGQSYDQIYCDFRSSASTAKATLRNLDFGAINGHNATILTALSHNTATSMGEVEIINSHLRPDQYTAGNHILSSGLSSANIRLSLINSRCDGGNSGDPLLGPYTYPQWFGCFSWDSPGSTTWGRNIVRVQGVYANDWAGNPFSTQAGNTDTFFQNVVTKNVSLNCGDSGPPLNGCHGTLIAHGTTIMGSSGSIKVQNVTAIYPYGQRNGVITGAISLQGGIGSANSMEVEINGVTVVANTGATPGRSTISVLARVGRVGSISSLKMKHLYANSHGTYTCFNIGGDLQSPSAATATLTPVVGQGVSIWNWSGFSGQVPLPFPGQTFVSGLGSHATKFTARMEDRGDGDSNLIITNGAPGFTLLPQTQIVALRLADLQQYPTLIKGGSGSNYRVSNGSGSGENRAAQIFTVAQVIMPAGSIDPNTGLPTTATFGNTTATFNGTMLVGGERTVSPASNNWSADAPALGSKATIDTDVHDLWMMNIAGESGRITLDGVDLASGSCPGAQPP